MIARKAGEETSDRLDLKEDRKTLGQVEAVPQHRRVRQPLEWIVQKPGRQGTQVSFANTRFSGGAPVIAIKETLNLLQPYQFHSIVELLIAIH